MSNPVIVKPRAYWADRPMAAAGFVSYRYKGPFGFVMIGATDDADALYQASRSLSSGLPDRANLQVWKGDRYENLS